MLVDTGGVSTVRLHEPEADPTTMPHDVVFLIQKLSAIQKSTTTDGKPFWRSSICSSCAICCPTVGSERSGTCATPVLNCNWPR